MKRRPIPKEVRKQVYDMYDGHCAYCGCKLEYKDMQVDHIDCVYVSELHKEPVKDTLDNYLPACRQCNFYKSTFTIEEFRDRIQTTCLKNLEATFNFKLLKKYNIIQVNDEPIKFYFEK